MRTPPSTCWVATMIVSAPRSARSLAIACRESGAVTVRRRIARSDLAERAQARLGVNLVLRQHHRGGTEAFDDRAHVGTDRRRRDQHWQLAARRVMLERLAQPGDEFLQLGWRHRQLALVA